MKRIDFLFAQHAGRFMGLLLIAVVLIWSNM